MFRLGFVLLCLLIVACNDKNSPKKEGEKEEKGFSYVRFSEKFHQANLPYQLTDTGLLKNNDTATIKSADVNSFIADSIRKKIFGSSSKIKYTPLAKVSIKDATYYIIKAGSGSKKAAFLLAFDKKQEFGAAFPFLVPDDDPTTFQNTVLDKSLSISRNVIQKKQNDVSAEGKDVFEYDPAEKHFALIMTDPLNDANQEVINPIDSFSRKHKFAGDYVKDKKNFVSVRDGRYPNQLQVFIHTDHNGGECTGELKGDVLITSSTTAIYRQGGDPCVLSFQFTPNSVILKEDQGCGSHRGVNCSFDGTFSRKKEGKTKAGKKKT